MMRKCLSDMLEIADIVFLKTSGLIAGIKPSMTITSATAIKNFSHIPNSYQVLIAVMTITLFHLGFLIFKV